MKEKLIEKIPYHEVQRSRKKGIKYILVTFIKIIGGEKILFVEVYNQKTSLREPKIRGVYSRKDWELYFPSQNPNENGEWTSEGIIKDYDNLRWRETGDTDEEKLTLVNQGDIERLRKWSKEGYKNCDYCKDNWIYHLRSIEEEIRDTKRKRVYKHKEEALKERNKDMPPVPDEFSAWYKKIFGFENLLYYKKHGRKADFICSCCGEEYTSVIKRGDDYESQFEHVASEPKNGMMSRCERCGAIGRYAAEGLHKVQDKVFKNAYLVQKFRGTGIVVRYYDIAKVMTKGLAEEYREVEIARIFIADERRRVIKDYHLNDPWGENGWYNRNVGGFGNIYPKEAAAYFQAGCLEETPFQYSGIREYEIYKKEIKPQDYLEYYLDHKYLEMLSKMKLVYVVDNLIGVGHYYCISINEEANTPYGFLKIEKGKTKLLSEKRGDSKILHVLQMEKEAGINWTQEQEELIAPMNLHTEDVVRAMKYMSMTQLINRCCKYAGVATEGIVKCTERYENLRSMINTYLDYIALREILGYDLHDGVMQYPRDITDAHNKVVAESNAKAMDKRIAEVLEKYGSIAKNYRKLRKKFFYEKEGLSIRPAKDAREIVIEGRTLHHCVGGDNYLSKHNDGSTYILFLRHEKSLEVPYITVEISNNGREIRQWYGNNDTKPDKEEIDTWLKNYLENLKRQMGERIELVETVGEVRQQVLMPAI